MMHGSALRKVGHLIAYVPGAALVAIGILGFFVEVSRSKASSVDVAGYAVAMWFVVCGALSFIAAWLQRGDMIGYIAGVTLIAFGVTGLFGEISRPKASSTHFTGYVTVAALVTCGVVIWVATWIHRGDVKWVEVQRLVSILLGVWFVSWGIILFHVGNANYNGMLFGSERMPNVVMQWVDYGLAVLALSSGLGLLLRFRWAFYGAIGYQVYTVVYIINNDPIYSSALRLERPDFTLDQHLMARLARMTISIVVLIGLGMIRGVFCPPSREGPTKRSTEPPPSLAAGDSGVSEGGGR